MQQSPESTPVTPRPPRSRIREVIVFAIIAAVMLAADLVVKEIAFKKVAGQEIVVNKQTIHDPNLIPQHDAVPVIPSVLSLKLTINKGAVFGLGSGGRLVFIGVTLIAIVVIVLMFWRSDPSQRWLRFAMALIFAGAIGNLYDRLFHHAVRDMLYLFPGVQLPFGLAWPGGITELYPWIFNIADVALVVGVILTLLSMIRSPK